MRFNRIIVALALLCAVSCRDRKAVPEVAAHELTHIVALPDSSFFSDLRQLTVLGDRLYALDIDRRQVLSLDRDLKNLQLFGSGGRGPAELTGPFSFSVQGDSVLINDLLGQAVKSYDTEGFRSKRSIDVVTNDGRWYAKGEEYWMPLRNADSLFVCSSPAGDEYYGRPHRFGTDRKTSIMNTCCVLNYAENPLIVHMMLPYAGQYSVDGVLKREIDLSGAKFYGQNMAYVASRPTKDNSAYILHQDAVIDGDCLYLLCPRYGEKYLVDRILVVNLPSGQAVREICLPEGVYGSIAVVRDTIYAFNSRRCSLDILTM